MIMNFESTTKNLGDNSNFKVIKQAKAKTIR